MAPDKEVTPVECRIVTRSLKNVIWYLLRKDTSSGECLQGKIPLTGKFNVHACYWKPRGSPTALVYFVPGILEYLSKPYDSLGKALSRLGCLCFGHDHVGFGESEGRQGLASDTMYVDCLEHISAIRSIYRSLPLAVVSNNRGCLLAVRSIVDSVVSVDCLVLMNPPVTLFPIIEKPLNKFLVRIVNIITPQVQFMRNDWNRSASSKYVKQLSWTRTMRLQSMLETFDAGKAQFKDISKVDVPTLVVAGDSAPMVSVNEANTILDKILTPRKSLIVIPRGHHNLMMDPDETKNSVVEEMVEWVKDILEL